MGKLLSLLARDESTCCTPQKYDVFLDFESKFDKHTPAETFLSVVVLARWICRSQCFPTFIWQRRTLRNIVLFNICEENLFPKTNSWLLSNISRCTTFWDRAGDLWSGAKGSEKFRIYLRGDSVLQRGRERNQRGDFGAHGGVSTKSLSDCCPSGCEAQKILWIFIGTWWVLIFHIHIPLIISYILKRLRAFYKTSFH